MENANDVNADEVPEAPATVEKTVLPSEEGVEKEAAMEVSSKNSSKKG